jgi:hypothetical protein
MSSVVGPGPAEAKEVVRSMAFDQRVIVGFRGTESASRIKGATVRCNVKQL